MYYTTQSVGELTRREIKLQTKKCIAIRDRKYVYKNAPDVIGVMKSDSTNLISPAMPIQTIREYFVCSMIAPEGYRHWFVNCFRHIYLAVVQI